MSSVAESGAGSSQRRASQQGAAESCGSARDLEHLEDIRHDALLREISALHARHGQAGGYLDTLHQALAGCWTPAADLAAAEVPDGGPRSPPAAEAAQGDADSTSGSEADSRRVARREAAAEALAAQLRAAEALLGRVAERHRDLAYQLRRARASGGDGGLSTPAGSGARPQSGSSSGEGAGDAAGAGGDAARRRGSRPASPRAQSPRQRARLMLKLRRRRAARAAAAAAAARAAQPGSEAASSSQPAERAECAAQTDAAPLVAEHTQCFTASPPRDRPAHGPPAPPDTPASAPSPGVCGEGLVQLLGAVEGKRARLQEQLALTEQRIQDAEQRAAQTAARAADVAGRKAATLQAATQQRECLRRTLAHYEAQREEELAQFGQAEAPERAAASQRWDALIAAAAGECAAAAEHLRAVTQSADACADDLAAARERIAKQQDALQAERVRLGAAIGALSAREAALRQLVHASPCRERSASAGAAAPSPLGAPAAPARRA